MKLKLSDLASIAEIVGALAVVVSLLYVARSLQDNTAAVQSASMVSVTNASRESLLSVASDADLARIRLIGDNDPGELNELDEMRYFLYYRQLWLNFQNAWTQWRLEIIEDEIWEGYISAMCEIMEDPGPIEQWPRHISALHGEFVSIVEDCPRSDG